jgi:hypothetical protein
MPNRKTLIDPIRVSTVVDRKTYGTLMILAGKRTIVEGRKVTLTEYVRRILDNAIIYDKSALDDTELDHVLASASSRQSDS